MSAAAEPSQPLPDNPDAIRNVLTDAAVATYLVQQGIVIVTLIRNAAALKTRRAALEAAGRVTTAAGWPTWKIRHLERVTHEIKGRQPLQVVVVTGKVDAR